MVEMEKLVVEKHRTLHAPQRHAGEWGPHRCEDRPFPPRMEAVGVQERETREHTCLLLAGIVERREMGEESDILEDEIDAAVYEGEDESRFCSASGSSV